MVQGPVRIRLELPGGQWHEMVLENVVITPRQPSPDPAFSGAARPSGYAIEGRESAPWEPDGYDNDLPLSTPDGQVRLLARQIQEAQLGQQS
jgi:hypothetical protein